MWCWGSTYSVVTILISQSYWRRSLRGNCNTAKKINALDFQCPSPWKRSVCQKWENTENYDDPHLFSIPSRSILTLSHLKTSRFFRWFLRIKRDHWEKRDCRRSLKTLGPIYSCKQSLKSCLRALRLTSLYVKNLGLFKFCWKVCSIKVEKKKVNTTIISEYAWICLNKQCQRSKYVRFLNMRALHNILNMPQYALTKFWIPKICKDSYYGIWLCPIQYIAWGHSTNYWVLIERCAYSESCQRSKILSALEKNYSF